MRAFSWEPGRSLSPLPRKTLGDSVLSIRAPQLCSVASQILTSKFGKPSKEKLPMCLGPLIPNSVTQAPKSLLICIFPRAKHGFSAFSSSHIGECPPQGEGAERGPASVPHSLWGFHAFAVLFQTPWQGLRFLSTVNMREILLDLSETFSLSLWTSVHLPFGHCLAGKPAVV